VGERVELHVTVGADGVVTAETRNVTGAACLDYVAVLEDLLSAATVDSSYTADYTRTTTAEELEVRDELRQY
jgi:hypothetical protein